jgi:hypothetical protein
MQSDDGAAYRKAQATSPLIARLGSCQTEKPLEDAFAKFRRYSRPLIIEAYAPLIAIEARAQGHLTTPWRDIQGVGEQIEKNPTQPARLNENTSAACMRANKMQPAMLRKHARVLAEDAQDRLWIVPFQGLFDVAGFGA